MFIECTDDRADPFLLVSYLPCRRHVVASIPLSHVLNKYNTFKAPDNKLKEPDNTFKEPDNKFKETLQ